MSPEQGPRAAGSAVGVFLVCVLGAGMGLSDNRLILLGVILLSIVVVDVWLAPRVLRGLDIVVRTVSGGFAGDDVMIDVEVCTTAGRWVPATGLRLVIECTDAHGTWVVEAPESVDVEVSPSFIRVPIQTRRRGKLTIARVWWVTEQPWGLVRRARMQLLEPVTVWVWPRPVDHGERPHGEGTAMGAATVREVRVGETVGRVHAALSARWGSVVHWMEEPNDPTHWLRPPSEDEGDPERYLEQCAFWMVDALGAGPVVGWLGADGRRLGPLGPRSPDETAHAMLEELARWESWS